MTAALCHNLCQNFFDKKNVRTGDILTSNISYEGNLLILLRRNHVRWYRSGIFNLFSEFCVSSLCN